MRLSCRLSQRAMAQALPSFVPDSKPLNPRDIEKLATFLENSKRLFVLTGAGLSTESGIPDYRSEKVGLYARTDRRPMQYKEFVTSASGRQRYWARNFVGWPQFSSFQPNIAHQTLSNWEASGKISWLVTQNVDRLHQKAGSQRVTELHGSTYDVRCLSCEHRMSRSELQDVFEAHNPGWTAETLEDAIAPDGDVMLTEEQVKQFNVPDCPSCGGVLKPDVIFFGDNVARSKVEDIFNKLSECDRVLVAGSSLFVYSGYRFVRQAAEDNKPIAVINIGDTRADKIINLKINAKCGDILPQIDLASL